MRVRIAMQGWAGDGPAAEADEIVAGVRLPWVELDGHRLGDGVIAAEFTAHKDSVSTCRLMLEIMGPIEVVYVDSKGALIPGFSEEIDPVDAEELFRGPIDAKTVIQVER